MAINGIGGISDPKGIQNNTGSEKVSTTYTANSAAETADKEEDALQTFEEEQETSDRDKLNDDKRNIYYQRLQTLYRQVSDLRGSLRNATMELAAGGDVAAISSTIQSIQASINEAYDNINNILLTLLSFETDLEASTLDYINGGSVDTSKYTFREGATEEGKNVVSTALQYDDKSQSEMKKIMQSKGYRFDDGLWCADFVTFILGEAYGKDNIPGDFINTCSNTAGCGSIKNWSQGNGSWTNNPDTLQPGDLVIFDWDGDGGTDHVGIFISKNADGTINTIEGNTSGSAGSSCVEAKIRAPKKINGYVRLSGLS